MNTVDIVLLIILGFGAVKGYMHGFIVEVVSLLGFFLGLIIALQLTIPITNWFFSESRFSDLFAILVFIGLFFLLSFGIKMGARMLKKMVDITVLGTIDNLIGALTGIVKWGFIVSMLTWVFESVGFTLLNDLLNQSFVFPYLAQIAPMTFGWFGMLIPQMQDLIDSLQSIPSRKEDYMTFVC